MQNDRVLHFEFSTRDELGDELGLRLIIEMMGRHSNIFLVSKRTGKIIDLIRHVSADQNRYRPLMPRMSSRLSKIKWIRFMIRSGFITNLNVR